MTQNISNTKLDNAIKLPSYDRSRLKSKIVHFGFGAFHRAHQALFTSELLAKNNADWGICEISLFNGQEMIKQLRKQNHLYTVLEKGSDGNTIKVSGSVIESLHPKLDGQKAILEKMAEEQVAIVSMTITEKGYCTDPSTGRLDDQNELIKADLSTPNKPSSAIGYIVEALRLRKLRNLPAFSVMSCDNVQENGHVARAAIIGFAKLIDPKLAEWIAQQSTFPCTMVDRIVPAVTSETLNDITNLLGVEDPCTIVCEPFRQWVIEDNFANGRPDWNIVGAEFVEDVAPFEEMKLRMLNGSHSFLAYLGYLGGYAHISDTMTNKDYQQAALNMMLKAQAPTLNMPEGTDLKAYSEILIERFSNPSLKHQTWQIAMDGSQKIPQRLGRSLLFHLKNGSDHKWLTMAIAGWMVYVGGKDETGADIDVRDPMLKQFKSIYQKNNDAAEIVHKLLSIKTIFGEELIKHEQFVKDLTQTYQYLISHGARAAVATL